MSLRRQRPNDSLDMLLDTMCNTFGGIILLAVLVTLLTSRERLGSTTATSDTREMVQRRLALANSDLQRALQLQASLQAKANDERWKTQVSLLATRQLLHDEINATRELAARDIRELDAAAGVTPADRMKTLNAQLAAVQTGKTKAQNSLAASKDNAKRLSARLADLGNHASDLVNKSQRQLRLPKEHDTDKNVLFVIVLHGRIYPCRNSDLSKNETDIDWTSIGFGTEVAKPKLHKGLEPGSAELTTYFKSISADSAYLAFCVYEDSFPAFIRAKQLATETGIASGWVPFRFSDGPVTFSRGGHQPKPQ